MEELKNEQISDTVESIQSKISGSYNNYLKESNKYNEILINYISDNIYLESISNGDFKMSESLETNEILLKKLILDSDYCKHLSEANPHYTLEDVKVLAKLYRENYHIDDSKINLAINQYKTTLLLIELGNKKKKNLESSLSNVLGSDVNCYKEIVEISKGKKSTLYIKKDGNEMENSRRKSIMKIDTLYLSGILSREQMQVANQMINKLFFHYLNEKATIPVELIEAAKSTKVKIHQK